MCVILYKSSKTALTLETLQLIVKKNPDGLGIAINKDNYWSVSKLLSPTDKDLKNVIKQCDGLEAVIHARIATSGGIDLDNCQPIHDKKRILFHNGIISSLNGASTTQSDTALLFEMLKSSKINRNELLETLAEKTGSKFVLIEKTNVLMFGSWSEYKGLKASNLLFVPPKPTNWGTWGTWKKDESFYHVDPIQYIPIKTYELLRDYFQLKRKDFEDLAWDRFQEIDWECIFDADFLNTWLDQNGFSREGFELTNEMLDPRK